MADRQTTPGSGSNFGNSYYHDEGDSTYTEAVAAHNRVWNPETLVWDRMTQPTAGEGGGGGAVTVADGADVAQGSTADADTANTVVGLLKKIKALLTGTLTVGGTVTANTGLTQPLTDAQLRATPVSVSGTVTASGPLTDTQLRTAPVPVSGTVTANTGLSPLTDTQLRATPVPVSGTFWQTTQSVSSTDIGTAAVDAAAYNTVLDKLAKIQKAAETQVVNTRPPQSPPPRAFSLLSLRLVNTSPVAVASSYSTLLHR